MINDLYHDVINQKINSRGNSEMINTDVLRKQILLLLFPKSFSDGIIYIDDKDIV